MLDIKNLKAGYGSLEILHGVDISVAPGEIVVLIGPNGAGKSTVLKSVFSLTEAYGGQIVFSAQGEASGGSSKDITHLKTHELINLGISFVPQGRQIFSNMTVLENLEMGAFVIADKAVAKERIAEIFKKFPVLQDKQHQISATLSGGQQQLFALARALMQRPKLLLLDEPSLGLSPKMIGEIFEQVVKIRNEGVAVLMVEQNAKQALAIADRTYILEGGKVALTGGREILNNPKIKDIYFGGDVTLSAH